MPNINSDDMREKAKNVGKDTILSTLKQHLQSAGLAAGGAVIGTAIGSKSGLGRKSISALNKAERKALITSSAKKHGFLGAAAGSMVGNTVVPAMNLKDTYNRELGENPTISDYAKTVAPRALPDAAVWGLAYKHRSDMGKAIENGIGAFSKFNKTKKIRDLRPALKGAEMGGGFLVVDKAADALSFLNTPESMARKEKEKRMNGGDRMDTKTALEIVDCAFDKMAEINGDFIEKEAGMGKDFLRVVSGKNVERATKNLEHFNAATSGGRIGGGVTETIEGLANNYKNSQSEAMKDLMKSKGVKLDRNGNKINTRYHNMSADQLKGELGLLEKDKRAFGNMYGKSNKDINTVISDIKKNRKAESSTKDGRIPSAIDNVINRRKYKANAADNAKLDSVINQMRNGKQVSVKDLTEQQGLFGKKRVNLGYEDKINDYNRSLQSRQKAQKKLDFASRSHADATHEMNYQNNYDNISKMKGRVDNINNFQKGVNSAKQTLAEGMKSVEPLSDYGRQTLEGRVNSERAKTTAARVGLGGTIAGGTALGAASLTSKSKDDATTKVAMSIIESALMER